MINPPVKRRKADLFRTRGSGGSLRSGSMILMDTARSLRRSVTAMLMGERPRDEEGAGQTACDERREPHDESSHHERNSRGIESFSNNLFSGRCVIRVVNAPSLDMGECEEGYVYVDSEDYFKGKRRTMQVIMQGQFRHRTPFSEVLTGQAFDRPPALPPQWALNLGLSIVRSLNPSIQENLTQQDACVGGRYILSPLIATAQTVHIAHGPSASDSPTSGERIMPPRLLGACDVPEQTTLLGGMFASGQVPQGRRKKHFQRPENLSGHFFEPDLIYTFDFYQHLFLPSTCEFDLGFYKLDVSRYLNRQPIESMAIWGLPKQLQGNTSQDHGNGHTARRRRDSQHQQHEQQYFWRIQIWHEKLLL